MNEQDLRYQTRKELAGPEPTEAEALYFQMLAIGLSTGKIDFETLWDEACELGHWDQQIEQLRNAGALT